MGFKKTVVYIAIVLLIIILLVYGFTFYYTGVNNKQFPPVDASCPDHWISKKQGKKTLCHNQNNLGKCHNDMDFSSKEWSGVDGICKKKKWAQGCNVTWDGITNSNKKC